MPSIYSAADQTQGFLHASQALLTELQTQPLKLPKRNTDLIDKRASWSSSKHVKGTAFEQTA